MDLQRFLPYAAIAIVTAFSLWSIRSRRCRVKSERTDNSEDGDLAEVSSGGGSEFEVFLSFRGEDTRNGFTGHLYDGLQDRGVSTFMDSDKLEKGEKIDKLLEYIDKSKICILIISKRYAESKWCLKEVAKCVEGHKEIIPVFFGVEPSDVRNQSGPFKSAFKKYESNKRLKREEVRKWREGLTKVGEISGFNLKDTNRDEVKLKRAVIERVLSKVNMKPLVVAKHPIGIETRVKDVKQMLQNGCEGVDVVGIHGMGGLGKTTIAKAIYNDLAKGFDGATCFLSNVRETAGQPNGLVTLQKQIFQEILKDGNFYLSNVENGASLIKERASNKRVMLVIDDVDSTEQLDALAGGSDWFGAGSVIIITTRDEEVLLAHNVKVEKIYKPQELNEAQSRELFMLHAFNGEPPQLEEYVELSNEVVGAAGGLPLTLEVVGSLLSSKKNVEEWKDTLKKLKKIPPSRVQQRLRLSFDSLDETEKKIFLDISCFYIGKIPQNAIYMWEDCEWFPNTAIRVLEQRSLIKISENSGPLGRHELFEMHDQIRDMGRAIVEEECSVQKQSRLLMRSGDSLDFLSGKVPATLHAEGISIRPSGDRKTEDEKYCVSGNCFGENMPNLRYLDAAHVNFQGTGFPTNLKWLQLENCDFDSMPSDLNMEKLVNLDLWRTNVAQVFINQFRLKSKAFEKLKVLSIRGVQTNFTLDFTNIPCLVNLTLDVCPKLTTIDESIGNLKNLTDLRINRNENVENLPDTIGKLTSLKMLDISWTNVVELPHSIGKLMNLRELLMQFCRRLSTLPDSICQLSSLQILNLRYCSLLTSLPEQLGDLRSLRNLHLGRTSIVKLPSSISQLNALQVLDLSWCQRLCCLPEYIGHMESLKKLHLSGTSIEVIPDSICQLKLLKCLDVSRCRDLCYLPEYIGHMESLKKLDVSGTSIEVIPDSICQLKLLESLNVSRCRDLCSLPERVGDMEKLRELILDSTGIKSIPGSVERLKNLRLLSLKECNDLQALPHSISNLTERSSDISHLVSICSLSLLLGLSDRCLKGLKYIHLKDAALEELPDCVGRMESLEVLLIECEMLKELPDSIDRYPQKLIELKVSSRHLHALPDCIGSLKEVQKLTLKCENLKTMPDSIGSLKQLEQLTWECDSLNTLPNSIGLLKKLWRLKLKCTNLETLPDSIGELENITSLKIESAEVKVFPSSFTLLGRVWDLQLHCINLEAIPDSIGGMKRLEDFSVQSNCLKALPASIGLLKNVRRLTLRCPNLEKLPDSIGELQSLRYFRVDSDVLAYLPDSIASLTRIEWLDINCMNMEGLPDSMGALQRLEGLTLHCDHLSLPPDFIGCLKHLNSFTFRSSSLKQFHATILGSPGTLRRLSLRGCENLEAVTGLAHLSCLRSIDLEGCKRLQYLPPLPSSLLSLSASECTNLKTMSDLSDLKTLENLNLGGCKLLEDVPGLENISDNLEKLELPCPCDFIERSHLCHDFDINKKLEKKEVTFKGLRALKTSGSLGGSATGKQRLQFMLPRLPFFWLRRAWLILRVEKVVPPIHVMITTADDIVLFEKIVEDVKQDNVVELHLKEECFLNIVEGNEEEHCYKIQVTTDLSSQLQNVSLLLKK